MLPFAKYSNSLGEGLLGCKRSELFKFLHHSSLTLLTDLHHALDQEDILRRTTFFTLAVLRLGKSFP